MLTVILNPASGASPKADVRRLVELFRAEHLEIRTVTLIADNADRIVRDAVASADDTVVAAGGDGTVSTVAAALAGGNTPLGILPFGTLNHFAKDLHIPMDTVQAVKTIATRQVKAVDLGYVNARAFINNSSIGVYPSIVQVREALRREGHNKWVALAIATARILDRDTEVFARLAIDGSSAVTRTPFVFIGNNEYTIEGIHLGSRARIDAGRLHAYFAPRLRTRDLPKLFLRALARHVHDGGTFATAAASEIWIDTPGNQTVKVAIDGEVTKLRTPLHYRVATGALKVIVPH